ncbi:MAG: aspartate--tRNA ligase [Phycisphaeraceae bacterium]|nr:aspartate--tRNA ligase [Phycisphaeraceae bacterium]MCW5754460.1 aspartate--tRNA ligase [Phycisphaeraceae bacterium]
MIKRTHTCGELRESHISQTVALSGWVNAYRGYGGLTFIDIRDRYGLTQLVFDKEDCSAELMELASRLRNEDVIAVRGVVRLRAGAPNPKLPTGQVEVVVRELELINKTDNPPFLPDDGPAAENLANEELRLKHRYIDLRRPRMQHILGIRHKVYQTTRRYFDENGFLEVETPILYKSTPEGAREFVVPCRNVPGSFYALPQSPQLFKQILMISGCDRYMQICRCFRDEDPRNDRQAEFTQIDLEMAFVQREDIMSMMEGFIRRLWKDIANTDIPPITRIGYREAMERYGIDRPDTRYGLEITDISEIARKTDFRVFQDALAQHPDARPYFSKKGVVKAIRVPGGAEKLTRKITDGYSEFVKTFGAGGVPTVKVVSGGAGASPAGLAFETGIAKFLEPVKAELVAALGLEPGDTVLFAADTYAVATKALGELRQKVARDIGLLPKPGCEGGPWNFLWVVDFPMFERNKDSGKWVALHHPFTAPREDQQDAFVAADLSSDDETIESIVSAGYDIVLNGQEIAGGSVRIHNRDVQAKVFQLLGMTPEQAREKFSFLLEALSYGAPPHAGIAFGLDRLIMNFVGAESIRDVIAFPKTMIGQDLMTRAPSGVTEAQLKELHLVSTAAPQG